MPRPAPTPIERELHARYRETYEAIIIERGKLDLAQEINALN